jgi:hypothetical protein
LTFNKVYSWLYGPGQWLTEINSITALLNNKEFFKLFNSIFNKIGYNSYHFSRLLKFWNMMKSLIFYEIFESFEIL